MCRWILCVCLVLGGCARSLESCRRDAEATQMAMGRLLNEVHSKEELRLRMPKVRRLYLELAQLMLAAEGAYDRAEWVGIDGVSDASAQLRQELIRIYELDGGQELMEEAQEDALILLARASLEGTLHR